MQQDVQSVLFDKRKAYANVQTELVQRYLCRRICPEACIRPRMNKGCETFIRTADTESFVVTVGLQ